MDDFSADSIIRNIVYNWIEEGVSSFLGNSSGVFEIDSKNSNDETALGCLVKLLSYTERDKRVMKLLLNHGANPLQTVGSNLALIGILASKNESELMIEFLSHAADIDQYVEFFDYLCTPLHLSVTYCLEDVVKYVLSRKPDVNKPESYSRHTPLHEAMRQINGDTIAKLLLENGANLEAKEVDRTTPLFWAVDSNRLEGVQLLLEHGANVSARKSTGFGLLHSYFFRNPCVKRNMTELLIKSGCDVNALTRAGSTPLHLLAKNNLIPNLIEIAEILIRNGANVDIQARDGETALHIAAGKVDVDDTLMKYLLMKGADPDLQQRGWKTFLDIVLIKTNLEKTLDTVKFIALVEITRNIKLRQEMHDCMAVDETISTFLLSCRQELNILEAKIKNQYSAMSIVFMLISPERKFCQWNAEKRLENFINELNMEEFPIYGEDLKRKLQRSLTLFRAENSFCTNLIGLSEETLDFFSAKIVSQFFDNDQLERTANFLESLVSIDKYSTELEN